MLVVEGVCFDFIVFLQSIYYFLQTLWFFCFVGYHFEFLVHVFMS
jgi:hypothetical protein